MIRVNNLNKYFLKILCIIFCLFILTGCSQIDNDKEPVENDKNLEENIDYNSAFKSVEITNSQKYDIKRIQMDSDFIGPVTEENILCRKDKSIVLENINTGKKNVLADNSWDIQLSPSKKFVLYMNDKGLNIYSISAKKNDLIYEVNDEIIRDYIISDDDNHILLQTVKDNNYYNRLITIGGETVNVVLDENDEFMISSLTLYSHDKLFAAANYIEYEDVSGIEINNKTDLVMIDFISNKIKNLTQLSYEDRLEIIDNYQDNILIKAVHEIIEDDDSFVKNEVYYKVNTSNGITRRINMPAINTSVFKIMSDEKEIVYLDESSEINLNYPNMRILKLYKDYEIDEIGIIYTDIPQKLYNLSNKIYLLSNGDLYVITIK